MNEQNLNRRGRPVGSGNKMTASLKEKLKLIADQEIEQLELTLCAVEPKERLDFLAKILPFILPRLNSIDEGEGEGTPVKQMFSNLSDRFEVVKSKVAN